MRMISLLAVALMLGSCTGTEVESTFDEHRAIWESAGLTTYEYELALDCFCPEEVVGPFLVSVADPDIAIARASSPDDPVAVGEILDGTIEAIFNLIEQNADADTIEVVYNAGLGYPTSVIIDPSTDVLDDEIGVSVRDFHTTEG